MEVDILIEDSRWEGLNFEELVKDALKATAAHLGLPTKLIEVSVLACDDARIAVLNHDFRDKAKATNVLSWPAEELASDTAGGPPSRPAVGVDGTVALGDIAISYDTCEREAADAGKPIKAHVTHLVVHGTLHLLGYDHVRDLDATLMQGIETEILGKMGLDDPYRE